MTGNKFDKNKTKKSYIIKNNLCEIIDGKYYKRFIIKKRVRFVKHKKKYYENLLNGI